MVRSKIQIGIVSIALNLDHQTMDIKIVGDMGNDFRKNNLFYLWPFYNCTTRITVPYTTQFICLGSVQDYSHSICCHLVSLPGRTALPKKESRQLSHCSVDKPGNLIKIVVQHYDGKVSLTRSASNSYILHQLKINSLKH